MSADEFTIRGIPGTHKTPAAAIQAAREIGGNQIIEWAGTEIASTEPDGKTRIDIITILGMRVIRYM